MMSWCSIVVLSEQPTTRSLWRSHKWWKNHELLLHGMPAWFLLMEMLSPVGFSVIACKEWVLCLILLLLEEKCCHVMARRLFLFFFFFLASHEMQIQYIDTDWKGKATRSYLELENVLALMSYSGPTSHGLALLLLIFIPCYSEHWSVKWWKILVVQSYEICFNALKVKIFLNFDVLFKTCQNYRVNLPVYYIET